MQKNQKGFTLVELIVVLLILGILAATIAPRFVDFTSSARTSAVKAFAGSMSSAAQMSKALQVTTGVPAGTAADMKSVVAEGQTIWIQFGYPTFTGISVATSFDATLFSMYTPSTNANSVTFRVLSAPVPDTCASQYTQASTTAGVTAAPVVVSTTTGC